MNNLPGILICLAFGLFLLKTFFRSLKDGHTTVTGENRRKITIFRHEEPLNFWSSIIVDLLVALFFLGVAFFLAR